jgi:hypothetical protein
LSDKKLVNLSEKKLINLSDKKLVNLSDEKLVNDKGRGNDERRENDGGSGNDNESVFCFLLRATSDEYRDMSDESRVTSNGI